MATLNQTAVITGTPPISANSTAIPFTYEAAAAAENDKILLLGIEAGVQVLGLSYKHDALGATNGLTFKLIKQSDLSDVATLATVADASSAGGGTEATTFFPTTTAVDCYLAILKTGAGTATGTVGGYLTTINRGAL